MAKEIAVFAGGCFWCMVQPFEEQAGIISVLSGYTGGHTENPTYEDVCSHKTGHTEAIEIVFDPLIITYHSLVELYWQQTDPTDAFGQFQDRGDSYRAVIFYQNQEQKEIAEASKLTLEKSGTFTDPIVTAIEPGKTFYLAEEYHQGFYRKNPERYKIQHQVRQSFIDSFWEEN